MWEWLSSLFGGGASAAADAAPAAAATFDASDFGGMSGQPITFDPGPSTTPSAGDAGGWSFGKVAKSIKTGLTPWAELAETLSPVLGIGTSLVGAGSNIMGAMQAADMADIAKRGARTQERIAQTQADTAAPLTTYGREALERSTAGEIPPAIQAMIERWSAGAKQQARDFLARAGQGDSSALLDWESWIDERAQAMAAQYLMEQANQGIGALGTAGSALGSAAGSAGAAGKTATDQASNIANLIAQANQQLSRLSGQAA